MAFNIFSIPEKHDKYKVIYNRYNEIEIGDINAPDFIPTIKLIKWNNECNFSIVYKGFDKTKKIKPINDVDGKLKYKDTDKEIHFYSLDDTEHIENDKFEYEIILNNKPATNIIEFDIDFKNLDFYRQSALTQEEINEGCIRPDDVIDSYAVYYKNKLPLYKNNTDAQKYRTGKAFHIYRPKILDNIGNWEWGALNIDEINKKATIVISQTFLDNAIYPIIIDPTFGYTTAGASSVSETAGGRIRGSKFDAVGADDISITKITTYSKSNTGGNISLAAAIYGDNAGTVDTKIGEDTGNVTVTTTAGWVDNNMSAATKLGSDFWLLFWSSVANKKVVYYDTGDANQGWIDGGGLTFETWPDPASGGTYSTRKHSIYATYTVLVPQPTLTKYTHMGLSEIRMY